MAGVSTMIVQGIFRLQYCFSVISVALFSSFRLTPSLGVGLEVPQQRKKITHEIDTIFGKYCLFTVFCFTRRVIVYALNPPIVDLTHFLSYLNTLEYRFNRRDRQRAAGRYFPPLLFYGTLM